MNWILPMGSSIIGALIGGAFLLGGQRWIKREQGRENAKIIFLFFLRIAIEINRLINADGAGVKIIRFDFNTDLYHDREQYLFTILDVEKLDIIFRNVKIIDNIKNSLIDHDAQPDTMVSYEYLKSLQESMITILYNLKPFAYRSKSELKKIDQALTNLKNEHDHFVRLMPVKKILLKLGQQVSRK